LLESDVVHIKTPEERSDIEVRELIDANSTACVAVFFDVTELTTRSSQTCNYTQKWCGHRRQQLLPVPWCR